MKLIYIIGKSSSGKDTIFNILKKELNVNTYVMYTTRPQRDGEIDGITYNFVTYEKMQEYINGNGKYKVIEYRTYNTVFGPWTYATIDDEQFKSNKDLLMIGTLESYIKIVRFFKDNKNVEVVPIYVEVPDNIRIRRALEREENQKEPHYLEMCRRFIADSEDFSEENLKEAGITKRFQNLDLNECIGQIKKYVL